MKKIDAIRRKLIEECDYGECSSNDYECCSAASIYRKGINDLWKKFFDDNKGGAWDLLEEAFKLGRGTQLTWGEAVESLLDMEIVP